MCGICAVRCLPDCDDIMKKYIFKDWFAWLASILLIIFIIIVITIGIVLVGTKTFIGGSILIVLGWGLAFALKVCIQGWIEDNLDE